MPIQRETFSYAYGVSVRRDRERLHYVGIHTFPMPLDVDDLVLIGGVLCRVEALDNDGCIVIDKVPYHDL